MCQSPSSSIVQRTIELKYGAVRRAASLRWLLANGALLAVLLLDLWKWCGVWWCYGVWAEMAAACALAASCTRHALRLAPPRAQPAPAALSPRQRDLLGLTHDDLDGSFTVSPDSPRSRAAAASQEEGGGAEGWLAGARRWRGGGGAADSPPPSPPASPPRAPSPHRADPLEFIADATALNAYIRQQEARASGGGGGGGPRATCALATPPARAHQLSVMPDRGAKEAPREEEGGAAAGGAGGARVWRRLRLDPQRLTEYNLNLRLWLHVSVVGRVARELAAAGGGALPPDHALTPFLKPFADRQYVAERITELARGGCLSAYRWNGGGRGWAPAAAGGGGRPADAELLLHLLATYLDLLVPGGDFSARHLSAGPAPPPPAPAAVAPARPLVLHRAARDPHPHYVLLLGDETVELPPGRNNLLHTLLLFLAAQARASPPALCRLHLGPAGLNMLWILGR